MPAGPAPSLEGLLASAPFSPPILLSALALLSLEPTGLLRPDRFRSMHAKLSSLAADKPRGAADWGWGQNRSRFELRRDDYKGRDESGGQEGGARIATAEEFEKGNKSSAACAHWRAGC